ncbi:hypothetical protein MIND_00897900 [Mycena indigotica]|uniref:Uncharacterized protein n=1 Tax=Mycena indigotica TaxID=2126181 RepID=A0A8H6SHJ9_9AGAR|nr:uncharacterized protein MIND_00897900 [Mycena indigotica]KAF7299479.1 hypothetical protein MIND_00897900 [Mycena indigotica]
MRSLLIHPSCKPRRAVLILVILGIVLLLFTHPTTRARGYTFLGLSIAPSYYWLRFQAERLPQHNLALPFPEGKTGRYVKFSVQVNFLGWNNCLGERLMNAHLAHVSNRAYVFSDYWWAPEHFPFSPAPKSGARTPMGALLAGPVVGGPWHRDTTFLNDSSHPKSPRAISERWWNIICPLSSRRLINTEDIKPHIPGGVDHAAGQLIFDTWRKLLLEAEESCVEIVYTSFDADTFPQIFDLRLWGGQRVLELWEAFSASPVSTLLRPSNIVSAAVESNLRKGVFHGRTGGGRPPIGMPMPFRHMLAIHLRRGDYINHCRFLASVGSGYYGWSQLKFLPDVAAHRFPGSDDPQREAKAFAMCLPDIKQVVARAHQVRQDWDKALDTVYLLTNESGEFLDILVTALLRGGWRTVVTTHDLQLDNEQLGVGMAVDMEIAKRAEVFLGNGWSSFTSNVIHQRLVAGKDPKSIRML